MNVFSSSFFFLTKKARKERKKKEERKEDKKKNSRTRSGASVLNVQAMVCINGFMLGATYKGDHLRV
jgi:hypothetical protein